MSYSCVAPSIPTYPDPWTSVNVNTYATFEAAIAALGSTTSTLLIPDVTTVSASTTVPANVTLWFLGDGQLSIASAQTVTINGPIQAPPRQIFAGSGTVAFTSNASLKEVYPQWWGAIGNGVADDTTAIQAAITAALDGDVLYFPRGNYLITTTITSTKRLRWQGPFSYGSAGTTDDEEGAIISGSGFTLLTMQASFHMDNMTIKDPTGHASTIGIDVNNGATGVTRWRITNSSIIAPSDTYGTLGTGIRVVFGLEGVIENNNIEGWLNGVDLQASGGNQPNANKITGNKIRQNTVGVLVTSCDNAFLGYNTIENNSTGVHGLSGKIIATANHFENNQNLQRQIHMNGAAIVSMGNGFYVGATTDKDIYIEAGAQVHMSIGDTLNAGIKHNGTGIFSVHNPAFALSVAGTGPIAQIDGLGIRGIQGLTSSDVSLTGFLSVQVDSHIALPEVGVPGGTANKGKLFVKDNGSGKSQLAVVFGTGAEQIIATEP